MDLVYSIPSTTPTRLLIGLGRCYSQQSAWQTCVWFLEPTGKKKENPGMEVSSQHWGGKERGLLVSQPRLFGGPGQWENLLLKQANCFWGTIPVAVLWYLCMHTHKHTHTQTDTHKFCVFQNTAAEEVKWFLQVFTVLSNTQRTTFCLHVRMCHTTLCKPSSYWNWFLSLHWHILCTHKMHILWAYSSWIHKLKHLSNQWPLGIISSLQRPPVLSLDFIQ